MELKNYIERYISISDDEFQLFISYLTHKSLKPKEKILDIGNKCNHRFYIKKGCVKLYSYNEKGNEQIYHFGIENWWITDYKSLLENKPSDKIIEAIESTEILMLSNENFEILCKILPKTERFFRIIMERSYIAFQNRLEFLFNQTSEEQYINFIERNGDFVKRVPQYMLASYLGVTPEFVSRVRSKK